VIYKVYSVSKDGTIEDVKEIEASSAKEAAELFAKAEDWNLALAESGFNEWTVHVEGHGDYCVSGSISILYSAHES
jgi:hypothetical protein